MQVMIDESEGDRWVSRRDAGVTLPLDELTWHTPDGLPCVALHMQLYYKAKGMRPRDEADFAAVLEAGLEFDVGWLIAAIERSYTKDHPWLDRLRQSG